MEHHIDHNWKLSNLESRQFLRRLSELKCRLTKLLHPNEQGLQLSENRLHYVWTRIKGNRQHFFSMTPSYRISQQDWYLSETDYIILTLKCFHYKDIQKAGLFFIKRLCYDPKNTDLKDLIRSKFCDGLLMRHFYILMKYYKNDSLMLEQVLLSLGNIASGPSPIEYAVKISKQVVRIFSRFDTKQPMITACLFAMTNMCKRSHVIRKELKHRDAIKVTLNAIVYSLETKQFKTSSLCIEFISILLLDYSTISNSLTFKISKTCLYILDRYLGIDDLAISAFSCLHILCRKYEPIILLLMHHPIYDQLFSISFANNSTSTHAFILLAYIAIKKGEDWKRLVGGIVLALSNTKQLLPELENIYLAVLMEMIDQDRGLIRKLFNEFEWMGYLRDRSKSKENEMYRDLMRRLQ